MKRELTILKPPIVDPERLKCWQGKIHDFGARSTIRHIHQALGMLPPDLAARLSARVRAIIALPEATALDSIEGASFSINGVILIFQNADYPEDERATTLHELAHLIDPGWEHGALSESMAAEIVKAPAHVKRGFKSNITEPPELFAELAAWELLGQPEIKYLPRSRAIVREALRWEG